MQKSKWSQCNEAKTPTTSISSWRAKKEEEGKGSRARMNNLIPRWDHPGTEHLKMYSKTKNKGRETYQGRLREEAVRSEGGGKKANDHEWTEDKRVPWGGDVQLKVATKLPKCTFSSTNSVVRVSPYKYWYAERFAFLFGRSGSGYSQLL